MHGLWGIRTGGTRPCLLKYLYNGCTYTPLAQIPLARKIGNDKEVEILAVLLLWFSLAPVAGAIALVRLHSSRASACFFIDTGFLGTGGSAPARVAGMAEPFEGTG